jgi:hypothetical protein
VEALVRLVRSSRDPAVLRRGAEALADLCSIPIYYTMDGRANRQRAVDAGALEALMQLSSSSSSRDPDVLCVAADALGNICGGDSAAIKQRAADAGAVEALVQLISSSKDQGVLR